MVILALVIDSKINEYYYTILNTNMSVSALCIAAGDVFVYLIFIIWLAYILNGWNSLQSQIILSVLICQCWREVNFGSLWGCVEGLCVTCRPHCHHRKQLYCRLILKINSTVVAPKYFEIARCDRRWEGGNNHRCRHMQMNNLKSENVRACVFVDSGKLKFRLPMHTFRSDRIILLCYLWCSVYIV